jgi:hypothetical protein
MEYDFVGCRLDPNVVSNGSRIWPCKMLFCITNHIIDMVEFEIGYGLKGKCALGPFLSILVIECQHKCLNVNQCSWMNKVQI